ncbi:MAG: cation diffusion facilitator family transporter [bacterium]
MTDPSIPAPNHPSSDKQRRYQATKQVTTISIVSNCLLAIAQVLGGLLTHSQALIADGIHTLSDLFSDFIVLIAAKFASQDADETHPYGHGRFETVATVVLGLILVGTAIGIFLDAVHRLLHPERLLQPSALSLIFAGLAIFTKEALYRYTFWVANRINSDLLRANAWHHRSDALSSLIVLIGIFGAVLFNLAWLDAVAAIVVSFFILKMGIKLARRSVEELVDSAVDPATVNAINSYLMQCDGVNHVHDLRTRKMAGRIVADVHLQVNPLLSVSEGHAIAERTCQQLKTQFNDLEDITIHIDPEDDEIAIESARLPSREQFEKTLQPLLQKFALQQTIVDYQLHYLEGQLSIDFIIQPNVQPTSANPANVYQHGTQAALASFVAELQHIPYLGKVRVYQAISLE